jgi:hypothetical protein
MHAPKRQGQVFVIEYYGIKLYNWTVAAREAVTGSRKLENIEK